MYGTRRDHQFRSSTSSPKDTASQQRDTDRFTDIWEVSILDADDLELHVEMTSLELDHTYPTWLHCEKFKQPFSIEYRL
jgi:hypothetical protein